MVKIKKPYSLRLNGNCYEILKRDTIVERFNTLKEVNNFFKQLTKGADKMIKKNVQTIRLKQDIDKHLFSYCLLRSARKNGDIERVNHTQLGRLMYQNINFEKINNQ